jgi:hypothetical protein
MAFLGGTCSIILIEASQFANIIDAFKNNLRNLTK